MILKDQKMLNYNSYQEIFGVNEGNWKQKFISKDAERIFKSVDKLVQEEPTY